MKDHALICKFIGAWPTEKELIKWIQLRWQLKGHIDLKLGEKGFFTVTFCNLEDKDKAFQDGPYFFNNAGLFIRCREECYNPNEENLLATPIWVQLFTLPMDFCDLEILEGIEKSIGTFVKVADSTRRGRYTSYDRINVYMNIIEPLPDFIELEYHYEVWQQPMDYQHIPFRCWHCHEYGHLFHAFPLNQNKSHVVTKTYGEAATREDGGGFQEVHQRKRNKRHLGNHRSAQNEKEKRTQNRYEVLHEEKEGVEIPDNPMESENTQKTPPEGNKPKRKAVVEPQGKQNPMQVVDQVHMEIDNQKEDLSVEEQVMKHLLQEWRHLDEHFIPEDQKQLYKETFQQYKSKQGTTIIVQLEHLGSQASQAQDLGPQG